MKDFFLILVGMIGIGLGCSKIIAEGEEPKPEEKHLHDIKVECVNSMVDSYEASPCVCKENDSVVELLGTRSCVCASPKSSCQVCIDGVCLPPSEDIR